MPCCCLCSLHRQGQERDPRTVRAALYGPGDFRENGKVIAGEWLESLKSGTKSTDRNWRSNSQIRSKTLEKLRYKCKRVGIRVAGVWSRETSPRRPRCGADGSHARDHPRARRSRRRGTDAGHTGGHRATRGASTGRGVVRG